MRDDQDPATQGHEPAREQKPQDAAVCGSAALDPRAHLCTPACLARIETVVESIDDPPTYRCRTHGATLRVGRDDHADIRRCLECGAWFWVEGPGARRTCAHHRQAERRLEACIAARVGRRS